jgi:hypothetical protein
MTGERRRPPPSVQQLCEGATSGSATARIVVCPVCGQMFDCRIQAELAHHIIAEHKPLLESGCAL